MRPVDASKCVSGSAPNPAEGAYSAPPDSPAGFGGKCWGRKMLGKENVGEAREWKGLLREGNGREGRARDGREGRGEERERGGKGRGKGKGKETRREGSAPEYFTSVTPLLLSKETKIRIKFI